MQIILKKKLFFEQFFPPLFGVSGFSTNLCLTVQLVEGDASVLKCQLVTVFLYKNGNYLL